MQNWYHVYESMSSKEREDFSRVVNHFLSSTFVTRDGDLRRDYYFVKQYLPAFEGYLGLIGWSLTVDDTYGVAFVTSPYAQTRLRLNAIQSAVLLTVRLMYEEARKDLNLSDKVVVAVEDLQSRLQAFKIASRPLDKKTLRECIALFKKHGLLEPLDGDVVDPATRLVISPAVLFAVRVESLAHIEHSLRALANSDRGEGPGDVETERREEEGFATADEVEGEDEVYDGFEQPEEDEESDERPGGP